jgi:hypothetical protein
MSFRFRRSISLIPGVKLNLGKTGASLSVGPRGAKVTIGRGGVRATAGIPGTGFSVSERAPFGGSADEVSDVGGLSTELEKIVRDRPEFWEFKLLQTALAPLLEEAQEGWEAATTYGVSDLELSQWIEPQVNKLSELLEPFGKLLSADLEAAFGPPGEPGDAKVLLSVVEKFGDLMESIIRWEEEVRLVANDPRFRQVGESMSGMSRPYLDALIDLQNKLDTQIPQAKQTGRVDLSLTMGRLPKLDEFSAALAQFTKDVELRSNEGNSSIPRAPAKMIIARDDKQIGTFSKTTVLENLGAGIFLPTDWYWSEQANQWESLGRYCRGLETAPEHDCRDCDFK